MTPIFREEKFFGKLERDTMWFKNFNEIALSHTVKEIQTVKFVKKIVKA